MNNEKESDVIINIFFIHYSKLTARKSTMNKLQKAFNDLLNIHRNWTIDIKQVTKFDPETLTTEFVKRIFNNEELKDGNLIYNQYKMSAPSNRFVSNCLKHLDAFNHISKFTQPNHINFIFEDDVVFDNQFVILLSEFIESKVYKDYDMVFLGMPGIKEEKTTSNSIVNNIDNKEFSKIEVNTIDEKDKIIPCCDSYFITQDCAKRIVEDYIPIRYPNNIQLSYVLDKCNIKCGKTFPNIVADGSKLGFFTSSISSNNILLFNNSYKFIYKLLNKTDLEASEGENIKTLFEQNVFKDSPDFVFLEGLFYMRIKQFTKSKELFDKAIQMYEDQHAPLDNSTAIIHNYIELCRHNQ